MQPLCNWLKICLLCIGFAIVGDASAHDVMPSIVTILSMPEGKMTMTVEVSQGLLDQFSKEANALQLLEQQLPDLIKISNEDGEPLHLGWSGVAKSSLSPSDVSNLADYKLVYTAQVNGAIQPIRLAWPEVLGDAILKVQENSLEGSTIWLKGGVVSEAFSFTQNTRQSFYDFVRIGFEHILPAGLDHILFIMGLYFFSTKLKPLLIQISAFTLAHTFTLFLATLGAISLDAAIVEPIIAMSIVLIAFENLRQEKLTHIRIALVFGFGLLHGLGFAGALSEMGIETASLVVDLIAFNLGIELGQLFIVLLMYLLLGYWFSHRPFWNSTIKVPFSLGIAAFGFLWFLQRL